jgi:alpha-L-fucosidase
MGKSIGNSMPALDSQPAPVVSLPTPPKFGDGRDWFISHRFGLFVHWGLFAIDAWQEQDIWRRARDPQEYAALAGRFNPQHFDPDAWIDAARAAGMTYLVFTTKHIEGFCQWDSALTDFKSTNTPFGRDVLAEVAAACARRDMPLCLYYSIVDLNHASYPHAGGGWEYSAPLAGNTGDKEAYLGYLRGQVEELCTRYGKIHGFWWDANPWHWCDPSINARIRELQPGIIINNRGFDEGDFGTPERDWDEEVEVSLSFAKPVEACQSLGSQSWGFRNGEDYYTDKHILRAIANALAKGGNYLLNTGPDADGRIAPEDSRMLAVIGDWMGRCREAFEHTRPCSHLIENADVLLTRADNTIYVILHHEPTTRAVQLKPFDSLPVRATLLNDGSPLDCRVDLLPWDFKDGRAFLRVHRLPLEILNATVPVLRLEFAADPARAWSGKRIVER